MWDCDKVGEISSLLTACPCLLYLTCWTMVFSTCIYVFALCFSSHQSTWVSESKHTVVSQSHILPLLCSRFEYCLIVCSYVTIQDSLGWSNPAFPGLYVFYVASCWHLWSKRCGGFSFHLGWFMMVDWCMTKWHVVISYLLYSQLLM